MVQFLWFWLHDALKIAQGNLNFMVWNTFLAIVPLVISLWLFRGQPTPLLGGDRRRSPRALPRPSILWWIGFATFIAFLPNAPYVLTDIIHLIREIRFVRSTSIITFVLVAFAAAAVGVTVVAS